MYFSRLAPLLSLLSMLLLMPEVFSQSGLSVSPPRTYFTLNEGETEIKTLLVSNPSKTSTLELAVSFNDWEYDEKGNNVIKNPGELETSCVNWINVLPESYFILEPGASYELQLQMNVPEQISQNSVHTTMMYITQINSEDAINEQGANIKISLRTGVKIYHRKSITRNTSVEPIDYKYQSEKNSLELTFINDGNVWADGTISHLLINQFTGEKIKLEDQVFYSMPGDKRILPIELPENLDTGSYIMSTVFDTGDKSSVKMAELVFEK